MILYILVEVFQLIVSGVYVSSDLEKVKKRFKEYTGVDYDEFKTKWDADKDLTSDMLLGDFDQTKIFEFEDLPTDFVICTHSHGCPLRWPQTNP